ncbi:hypothetical protein [Winogradskyella sp.]|uniref:hypothetical protein n=1 Tax=Winogradskyella sp. TaxID=1883156 RepID=UPI002604F298|nr:hypothetical protein [Winogradskyella sp.]
MPYRLIQLCYALILCLPFNIFAQELPKIVPPSPEAAELIKYSQTQISPYTGLPNIQIPFYTIDYGGVSVPIALAYSGGGIKVADIASWVGLGWNLQAGGLVSRTINWLPDDNDLWGYMYTSYDLDHFRSNPDSGPFCCDPNEQGYQLLDDQASVRDYEPDEFNYSIPGYSGTFYFDQEVNDFVQLPKTNVNIEKVTLSPGNRKIIGFKITTPNGVIYHFGGAEPYMERIKEVRTMSHTNNGVFTGTNDMYTSSANPFYQSWMLREVEFPTSDYSIEFEYDIEDDVQAIIKSNEEFIPGHNSSNEMAYKINYTEKKFSQPKIKNITFPSGRVEFSRSNVERLDLKNGYPLETITLLNNDGIVIKEMKLETSISEAIPDNEYPFFRISDEFYKRLRLNKVSISDPLNQENKEYILEYNPQKLPHRFSRSIDYFGYFNGEENIDLIPRANYIPSVPSAYFGKADRSVQPEYTQAEVLTKIIYPTGGHEEFIWDNNTISFFVGGSANQYKDYLKDYIKNFHSQGCMFEDTNPSNNFDYSMTIDIPSNSDGITEFDITVLGCPYNNGIQVLNDSNCTYSLFLIDVTDTPESPQPLLSPKVIKRLIPGNTYKIAASYNGNFLGCEVTQTTSPSGGFSVVIKYSEDPTPGEYMFAGLRIKELKAFDNSYDTIPQLWKKYDYTFHDQNSPTPDITSGVAYSLPINYIGNYRRSHLQELQIFSNAPLLPINGTLHGYLNVTESYHGQSELNGYKQYSFSDFDIGSDYLLSCSYFMSGFPIVHKKHIAPNWRNGNLIKTTYFNKLNLPVKEKIYVYENVNTYYKDCWDFAVQVYRMPDFTGGGNNSYVALYGYTTEYHRLKSQTNIDYLNNNEVITTTHYHYDNNPLLASKVSVNNSAHLTNETHTLYAHDIPIPTSAEQKLIDQNRYEPIETKALVKDGNTLLSSQTQKTIYKDWGNDVVLPEVIETSKNNSTLEPRVNYHAYDTNGNPTEVSKTEGTSIIYVWGYKDTQPIAKIENASYDNLTPAQQSAIDAAKLASDNDIDEATEATLRTALENLRQAFPYAMVSTYTYDSLIGVTSTTDPRGYTSYYEYDDFNRLKLVKDQDGNILNQNEYNYGTQN